jgi:hypothetical protein
VELALELTPVSPTLVVEEELEGSEVLVKLLVVDVLLRQIFP